MKDKWLKDIHDRMADFNIDEPDRLWEDIEASGILDRISRRNRHRHAIIAWTKRICAAAAVVAIAILTGTQFYNGTPSVDTRTHCGICQVAVCFSAFFMYYFRGIRP